MTKRVASAALFACLAFASIAEAEEIVPPHRIDATLVLYPKSGSGDAKVVVLVDVDDQGHATDVKAIEGEEPFVSSAIAAARSFRFSPATIDGAPIAAKVRLEIDFTAPPKPIEAPKPIPAETPAVQLIVEGEREEVAQTTIEGKEVRRLPGAFGDPFRMIEALPGVVPIVSGLPFFYVRGAPPGNTGYFVDDIPLPLLFHVGAGPSVLAAGLVDHVDFFAGGYPARYGRYTGGIVAGETAPPLDHPRVEYGVRNFDANALVEVPIADGKGDVLVAGRYGYPGLLLSLLSSSVGLQYWDYQLRAGYRVDDRDRVSVFAFGAFDQLTDKTKNQIVFGTQFHRVDVRLDHKIEDGSLRLATTLAFDQTQVGGGDFATTSPSFRIRVELDRRLSEAVRLRAGADVGEQAFSIGVGNKGGDDAETRADVAKLFPSRLDRNAGIRADFVIKPAARVEIVPGARVDLYQSGRVAIPAFDPRLAVRVGATKHLAWISALAVAHQPPAFIVPVPGLEVGSLANGLQEAYQFSEGVEFDVPSLDTLFRLNGFYHALRHVDDVLGSCSQASKGDGTSSVDCSITERPNGRTVGLELFVKRDFTKRFSGWISYTLSRSDRFFRGVTLLSQFDRTHVLAVVASYDLGRGWRAGARWSYVSGTPYDDPNDEEDASGKPTKPIGRLPAFNRLDLRLEKRWTTSERRWISFVAEWFNATLRKEATDYSCDDGHCGVTYIGPVTIPSIGLEGAF